MKSLHQPPQMLHSSGTRASTYIMWGLIAFLVLIIIISIIMYIYLTNKVTKLMKNESQIYESIMNRTYTTTTTTPSKKK